MRGKSSLVKFHNINAQSMTGTSVITSAVTSIKDLDDVGIQLNWTSSPVGNFRVQVSIDHVEDDLRNVSVAGNWVPLLFSYWNGSAFVTSYDIPTSLGSSIFIDMALLSAPWMRVIYTNASSSGTLDGFITAKQL